MKNLIEKRGTMSKKHSAQKNESTDSVEDAIEISESPINNSETEELDFIESQEPVQLIEEEAASEEINANVDGTELENFEVVNIDEIIFVEQERVESIIESILFASDRPVSLASLKVAFKGTQVKTEHIRRALEQLAVEYAGAKRGVTLDEVTGGFQLRTKIDNMDFIRRNIKARSFKLSGPALEVLSIVAYKQPVVKSELDAIRGVESGHLLRALMERGLVNFEGKSELPGRPMQYGTTRKFLEIFGLRNLKELPTLSQIDELLPEGIGEDSDIEKQKLSDITSDLSQEVGTGNSYSQGEEEHVQIQEQLEVITTSTRFFEEEKERQRQKRDEEKAQNIREALLMGEEVSTRDQNWLKKYELSLLQSQSPEVATVNTENNSERSETVPEEEALFENEDIVEELPELASDEELEGV